LSFVLVSAAITCAILAFLTIGIFRLLLLWRLFRTQTKVSEICGKSLKQLEQLLPSRVILKNDFARGLMIEQPADIHGEFPHDLLFNLFIEKIVIRRNDDTLWIAAEPITRKCRLEAQIISLSARFSTLDVPTFRKALFCLIRRPLEDRRQ
jgi:hypothetical protein